MEKGHRIGMWGMFRLQIYCRILPRKKDSTFGLTSFHLFALPGAGLRIIAFKAKFDVVSNCSDRVVGKSGRSPLPKEEGRDSQSQLVA